MDSPFFFFALFGLAALIGPSIFHPSVIHHFLETFDAIDYSIEVRKKITAIDCFA